MHITASPTALTIPELPTGTASIDVHFDDARVWSIDVRVQDVHAGSAIPAHEAAWPEVLLPFLSGSTLLSITDSGSGAELAAAEITFTNADHRTSVVDAAGVSLAVNKWGRLGVALEDMGAEVQSLIVQRAATIVDFLHKRGLRPFVVGGTLLGAVRAESLLPHDDDADVAYLSRYTTPADVASEAFRLGHELEAAGYEIRRHSAAHMQLLFRNTSGQIQHYIDVFTAFFTADGYINQPFHVRGKMREDQMLPFRSVRVGETVFPAPADSDHWLTINYDENWRTPIPGYRLETPLETSRRFNTWFGSYNLHREFWDEWFAAASAVIPKAMRAGAELDWEAGRQWLRAADTQAPTLIDLGCGAGALTHALARQRPDRRVIGADFCQAALTRATAGPAEHELSPLTLGSRSPEFAHVNLYRATAIALPRDLQISGAFDLVANHLCEQLGHLGREPLWRLARMALRTGGSARFTFHGAHAQEPKFEDPTGWHLTREQVTTEAARFGLTVAFTSLSGAREATGAEMTLATAHTSLAQKGTR